MEPLREQIARELAALFAFVDSVSAACIPPPRSVAFTDPSERFFTYIESLAKRTKDYLSKYPVEIGSEEQDFLDTRQELATLRSAWRELHQFIKPAADADTLNQPTALVDAVIQRLHLLPGFDGTDFTIFHTDTFNYLQVNPSLIRRPSAGIASIVGGAAFPDKLALIGIPNSQGNTVLLNCLLAHEVGHYVYSERGVAIKLSGDIEGAIKHSFKGAYEKKDALERSVLVNVVAKWAEELFCDLFAVQLVGPCYTFAYVELYDLVNLLDKSGTLAHAKLQPQLAFYREHPSHPFRVKYQADLLRKLGWWDQIVSIKSRYVSVLQQLLAIDDKQFKSQAGEELKLLVEAFLSTIPVVSTQLGKITGALDPGVHEFGLLWEPLAEYLGSGVVPSTIYVKKQSGEPQRVHPTEITLLNASSRFCLEKIESLMSMIENEDAQSLERRVHWIRKVESWTSKALEDIRLINRRY